MPKLWVFGYGSLIWNPGFQYTKALVGQIKGYSRKFFQGSDVHRGRPDRLGRVVTLIKQEKEATWGMAYEIKDEDEALSHLSERENQIGGYTTFLTEFYPRDPREKNFTILVYVALPSNPLFLGSSNMDAIAHDIAHSQGNSGHNVEYLAKLAAFMKIELPEVKDEHLHVLEDRVKLILKHQQPVLQLFEDAIQMFLTSSVTTPSSLDWQEGIHKHDGQDKDDDEDDDDEFDFEFELSHHHHPHLRCLTKF